MERRWMRYGLLVLTVLAVGRVFAATDLVGVFTLAGGYMDHPLGVSGESSAGYAAQTLRLDARQQHDQDAFRLGYELAASQFGNDTGLGSLRHALGWQWQRRGAPGTGSVGLGVEYAMRSYQDTYAPYDHQEGNAYAVWKTYLAPATLFKATGTFRYRRYRDLPEESYLEPRLDVELKRFFATRTTVGFTVAAGWKRFYDSAASRVWETPQLPSASQLAARLNFSQGLSSRTGLRAWVEQRFSLEDFPHYVGDDVFDSPLLDFYAHEGTDALAAVKWLSPLLVWVEGGYYLGEHDYGDLLFVTDQGGATRQDTVRDAFLSLERTFAVGRRQARFRVATGWRNQDSNLDTYRLSGGWVTSSLTYPF